jgi:hypothetical protein
VGVGEVGVGLAELFAIWGVCAEGEGEDGVQRRMRMCRASSGGRRERMSV